MSSPAIRLGTVLLAAAAAAGFLLLARAGAQEEKALNVYNLPDYIGEHTVEDFERQTGISVHYDVYESDATLESKLTAGHTGYDVVVASDDFIGKQAGTEMFRALDKRQLPGLKNLDPAILRAAAVYDPGNAVAVPYFWGTIGVGINAAKIKQRAPDAPVDSLDMIFKPDLVKKFADCGVALPDSPGDMLEIILNYLGRSPYTAKKADYAAAEQLMRKVRPYIKYFSSTRYVDDIADGEICLAIGWNGDFADARSRAAEAKTGIVVSYAVPREGTQMWIDNLAVPSDAAHPANAYRFIDYLMDPQIAADGANAVDLATPNLAALPLVKGALRDDPGVYPPAALMAKLFPDKAATSAVEHLRSRTWARIKEGE